MTTESINIDVLYVNYQKNLKFNSNIFDQTRNRFNVFSSTLCIIDINYTFNIIRNKENNLTKYFYMPISFPVY